MRYVAIGTRVTLGFDGAPVGTVIGDAIHDGADYSVVHWDGGEVAEHASAALVTVECQLTPARLNAIKSHLGLPRDYFDRRANGTETGCEDASDGDRAEAPDDAKRL